MSRLTKPGYKFNLLNVMQGLNTHAEVDEVLNRLAAYEDTGLEPEEIKDHEEMFAAYRHVCGGKSPEEIVHALELMEAERNGRLVVLPCKAGDTVYVIAYCADIIMNYDDNYETGTGAIECPFENDCQFEDCDDGNRRVFETTCSGFFFDKDRKDVFFDHINAEFCVLDFGKTVFLTREEAEAALAKEAQHE